MLEIATCRQTPAVQRFSLNRDGRDFVVGDIHGMFGHLRLLLWRLAFDPRVDRLFSVGDLIDRGPDSRAALDWLRMPWFHACRGNHEQFAIDSVVPRELEYWVGFNGGEWWLELAEEEQAAFRRAFLAMPLAIEVETAGGLVGLVHADVPPALRWERFVSLLEAGQEDVVTYALSSRYRLQASPSRPGPVGGAVIRIYCGHTPVREPIRLDNVHYIDTGAVYIQDGYADARLTLVEIHPEAEREHSIRCGLEAPALAPGEGLEPLGQLG
jgi:serine/threonine protein phosphatase 1